MFFLQRQGKVKVIFRARSEQDSQGLLSGARQSKVVKILLFRARSRQGLGSLFVERVEVFF